MDLLKAFDTINHELLVAKSNAYCLSEPSLKLIYNYLKHRLQHIKINSSFSEWSELIEGVPQGFVLGTLLFNIYLNDLFHIVNDGDIYNYANDTTPNVCDSSLKVVIEKLEKSSQLAVKWFSHNYMKLNAEKCEFLITGHRFEHLWLNVGETQVCEKNQVKLLGITIENELKFNDHITKTCCEANSKLIALSRLPRYLLMKRKKFLYMSFIEAQFKYCSITWMFSSQSCNNKINKLQERALKLVYDDCESSFDVLLNKNKSFSIHH